MSNDQLSRSVAQVEVNNIGGIDEATVSLGQGVSILAGSNATNRTSFLQALMTGLGSKRSSLKGDADNGSVTIELDGNTYTRTLTRQNGAVIYDGDPYLDDPELADLFAFLLENNEARRAVAQGDDLREIIMRPIDTDRMEAEIEQCQKKREEIEEEIDRLDELERELPELEERRREKQEELESAHDDLEAVQEKIEEYDADIEQSQNRKQKLEDAFQRVRDAQSELEDLEFDLETEQSTLSELEAEQEELEQTYADIKEPEENCDQLAGRIDELRRRKRSLDDTINQIGSVVSFNEDMLDEDGISIDEFMENKAESDPTDALIEAGNLTCWTCGSEVNTDQVNSTLDELRDFRSQKLAERSEVDTKIDELTDRQSELKQQQREADRVERRLSEVSSEIKSTQNRIENLQQQIEQKETQITDLEAEAESIELGDHDEVLELHREANGIELRIENLEAEIEAVETELEEHKNKIGRRESLKKDRNEYSERLTELRTRVDRIEQEAVDSFNEHMQTVLDLLEYDNLERIWIERRETEVREGRRKVTRTRFDLHVVRTAASGSAYEDTVEHLSESEREVTGLVFALAGYLVHDVDDVVPFVILDSLEAIDANRIARVVEYFRSHADYLVTALLPEDAAALSDEYRYIETIE
jgi:DNA repair exonuclease SbcCD ATPase subunit